MEIVLDIAFVVAIVAFLKEQLGVSGKIVLLYAFLVALFFGFAPLIAGLAPPIAPFLDVIVKVAVLFLGAAGSWDAVKQLTAKKSK